MKTRGKATLLSTVSFVLLFIVCAATLKNNARMREVKSQEKVQIKIVEDKEDMELFINDFNVPVIWEKNATVEELKEQVKGGEINVKMSMYGGNEQVGSLGRSYSASDAQTRTQNGDIVLYAKSNIVVFYGSNSWAYTRLGKMDMPKEEVTELLSNGDVTLTLK